jgi:hypothetical protein
MLAELVEEAVKAEELTGLLRMVALWGEESYGARWNMECVEVGDPARGWMLVEKAVVVSLEEA